MTTEEQWLFFDTSAPVKYVHEKESEGERRHFPTVPCVIPHDTACTQTRDPVMNADSGLRKEVTEEMETLPEDQLRDVLEFVASLRRESSSPPTPIEEKIEARLADVPDEALDELPEDASENLDHYLYGAPKNENVVC